MLAVSERREYAPYRSVGVPRNSPDYWKHWYARNKKERQRYNREIQRAHRAQRTATERVWQRKNKTRRMLQQRMREQIRRWEFFRLFSFTCAYCGREFDEYTAMRVLTKDHKVARAVLGDAADQPGNLVCACFPCNRKKGTKSYDYFMTEMRPDRIPDWVETGELT